MDYQELKLLEDDLWEAADQLRANSKLTASEYSMPVLGLIFLRHAATRFNAFHCIQLTPSPGSRMKRTPAAKPMTRCRRIQMVLTPGSPPRPRARKPPSIATRRTTSLSEGGAEGKGLFVNTYAALISSGANISEAGKSGQVRPSCINRAIRQDTTMNSANARSILARLASCSASRLQPVLSTWKNR